MRALPIFFLRVCRHDSLVAEGATTSGNVTGIPNILAGIVPGSSVVSGSFTYEQVRAGFSFTQAGGTGSAYALTRFTLTVPLMELVVENLRRPTSL